MNSEAAAARRDSLIRSVMLSAVFGPILFLFPFRGSAWLREATASELLLTRTLALVIALAFSAAFIRAARRTISGHDASSAFSRRNYSDPVARMWNAANFIFLAAAFPAIACVFWRFHGGWIGYVVLAVVGVVTSSDSRRWRRWSIGFGLTPQGREGSADFEGAAAVEQRHRADGVR